MNSKKHVVLCLLCISASIKSEIRTSKTLTLKSNKDQMLKEEEQPSLIKDDCKKTEALSCKTTNNRVITVTNTITDDMTHYKKFNQKYKPDSFTIRVNNTPISQNKSKKVLVKNDTIDVEYEFKFAGGLYKGTRKKSFTLNSKTEKTELTFDWNDEHRLHLSGAKVDTLS